MHGSTTPTTSRTTSPKKRQKTGVQTWNVLPSSEDASNAGGVVTRSQEELPADFFEKLKSPLRPRGGPRFFAAQYFQLGAHAPVYAVAVSPHGTSASSQEVTSPFKSFGSPDRRTGKPKHIDTRRRRLHLRASSQKFAFYSEEAPERRESEGSYPIEGVATDSFKTVITAEVLEFMARYSRYNKGVRYPDQKALFDNKNATQLASTYGYSDSSGEKWQYCHISAHSLGGLQAHRIVTANDGIYRRGKLKASPQDRDNLFIGTTACNGQMLVVEMTIKQLLESRKVDRVELSVEIDYDIQAGKKTKMAEELRYTLTSYLGDEPVPVYVDTFTFRPKSLQKPLRSYPKRLKLEIEQMISAATSGAMTTATITTTGGASAAAAAVDSADTELDDAQSQLSP